MALKFKFGFLPQGLIYLKTGKGKRYLLRSVKMALCINLKDKIKDSCLQSIASTAIKGALSLFCSKA